MHVKLTHSVTRACASVFLPPNPNPRTHNILDTKMCANYANLRQVRQVNWKLKTNCKFAYRSIVARFLRRTRCKYQKNKTKPKQNQKSLTLPALTATRNTKFNIIDNIDIENRLSILQMISLFFQISIYALSMPTYSTPTQSCIKFRKRKIYIYRLSMFKSTHTVLWLFLNKQINQSVDRKQETISCNSRPKASD